MGVGGGNVPAAVRVSAMGSRGPQSLVGASGDWRSSGFAQMSGTLNYIARQAEKAEDRAYAEETHQRQRAERKADAAEQRELNKAAALEEKRMLADAKAIAANGVLSYHEEIHNGIADGSISNIDHLKDIVGRIKADAEQLGDPLAKADLLNRSTNLLDDYAPKLFQINEQKRLDSLADRAATLQASLVRDNHMLDDDQWMESYSSGLPVFLEAGGTEQQYRQNASNSMMAAALAEAGTTRGSALYDRLERFHNSGKLLSNSPENLQKYYEFRTNYRKASLDREDTEERLAKKKEGEEQEEAYFGIINGISPLASPDELGRLKAQLFAETDALREKLGEHFYSKLVKDINTLESTALDGDSREKAAAFKQSAEQFAGAQLRIMQGDFGAWTEAVNSDMHPLHKTELNKWMQGEAGSALELYGQEITLAKEALLQRFPREGSLEGVYVRDADGTVKFDPYFEKQITGRLAQAALNVHKLVDPSDTTALAQRDIDVSKALQATVEAELKNIDAKNVQTTGQAKATMGEARPRLGAEYKPEDFPTQYKDLERELFSNTTGYARTQEAYGGKTLGTSFNVKYYEGLPPDAKETASNMLRMRAVQEDVKKVERANNSFWRYLPSPWLDSDAHGIGYSDIEQMQRPPVALDLVDGNDPEQVSVQGLPLPESPAEPSKLTPIEELLAPPSPLRMNQPMILP